MPLDWLNTPLDADLGELIARKKKNRVIESLREQVQGRLAPSVNVRLQLADLLIQAGRGVEAVPVLTGLADEFTRDGFVAKAIAILKRIERVEPGRPDVQARLERLVHEQRRAAAGLPPPRVRGGRPELGIEDIGDARAPHPSVLAAPPPPPAPPEVVEIPSAELAAEHSAPVEVAPEPLVEPTVEPVVILDPEELTAEPSAASDTPPAEVEADAEVVEMDDAEVEAVLAAESLVSDPGATPEAPVAPAAPASAGVANRIRRVFRRFLSTLPGSEPSAPTAEPVGVSVPEDSEVTPVPAPEDTAIPDPEVLDSSPEPIVEPETPVEPEPEVVPEPVLAAEPEAPSEPEPIVEPIAEPPSEPLSDEAFQEQLLDIVEDVLRAPASAPAVPPRVELPGREQTLDLARRLLASRLLHELGEDELLAVVRGLRLHTLTSGDVVVSEGEPGQGLFLITTGRVKVFVVNPDGRNFEVALLGEGEFFGEISSLSGRPRTATVVAAEACELLELDRPTLDGIARTHPRVREVLESSYIDRASSPEVAAVRAVALPDEDSRRKAIEVLEAHFGESRWDPRMRLRLAELLLRAGKDGDAVDILIGLADDLAKEGFPDKAIAILKKVEKLQRRNVEVVNLAPLAKVRATARVPRRRPARAVGAAAVEARRHPLTDDRLHGWLVELVRHTVAPPTAADVPPEAVGSLRAYGPGLLANPLFEDFTDDELVALIQGLRLLTFDPGDVVVTEGETGQSVFILTTGRVKVFVRAPDRRSVGVGALVEGTFFGEISTLSGNPRSATVIAAAHCEMLELDRAGLDRIAERHPRVRRVLEEYSAARASDPDARRAREGGAA